MADRTERDLLLLVGLASAGIIGLVVFGIIDYTTRFM